MKRTFGCGILAVTIIFFAQVMEAAPAPAGTLRVAVFKPQVAGVSTPSFQAVDRPLLSSAGFGLIVDYPTFSLFEGPAAGAESLAAALNSGAFHAYVATDLDAVHLRAHDLDADSGIALPPYADALASATGPMAIYVLAFRGYPLQEWLDDLQARGLTLLSPVPPAGYIVRGQTTLLNTLSSVVFYVRGAFPMSPGMKTAALDATLPPAAPSRRVFLEAYDDSTVAGGTMASILAGLNDSDSPPALISRDGAIVRYTANLTDFDIAALALSDRVFAIDSAPAAAPSSERQGVLLAQPVISSGRVTLPTTNPSYTGFLTSKCFGSSCITDFSNTKVAMLDTGFDSASFSTHPDFLNPPPSGVIRSDSSGAFNQTPEANEDDSSHGTATSAEVNATAPVGSRSDSGGYRYTEGIAPGVLVAMDKVFSGSNVYSFCVSNGDLDMVCQLSSTFTQNGRTHTSAFDQLALFAPNILNSSWNSGTTHTQDTTCVYDATAQLLDKDTRNNNRLHSASAGNSTSDVTTCPYVRSPALGRNVLAVGATENYTLTTTGWQNNSGTGYVLDCAWNNYSSPQDARNIPSFSGIGRGSGSQIKPDVVAPAMRVTFPVTRANYHSNSLHGIFCNESIDGTSYSGGGVQYGFSGATSFAAPVGTGAAAVVRKWYRLIKSTDPHPAMTKALLIMSARDIAGGVVHDTVCSTNCPTIGHIPDIHQGWGMLSFDKLLLPASKYLFADQTAVLTPGGAFGYQGFIVDGTKETRVVVAWTDAYQSQAGGLHPGVVNSLFVTAADNFPTSTTWYSNNFNTSGQTIPNSSNIDGANNVQEIVIPAGTYSTGNLISITVFAHSLTGDGITPSSLSSLRQDFALVAYNIS